VERASGLGLGRRRRRAGGTAVALGAVLAFVGLAGCVGPTHSPSAQFSAAPRATPTLTASPVVTPTPTPIPTPTPTPTFVATGKMHGARVDATATFLQDGKVLIAGGSPDQVLTEPVLASAELYDPTTGEFTPTGSMATARTDATATLLPDGRVLIAGGWGCPNTRMCSPDDTASGGGALASAELYDPATGKFSRTVRCPSRAKAPPRLSCPTAAS
jgi:Galactose oxidase, central domain